MPLTRAIDTVVISLKSRESEIGKILFKIAEENSDYINWV